MGRRKRIYGLGSRQDDGQPTSQQPLRFRYPSLRSWFPSRAVRQPAPRTHELHGCLAPPPRPRPPDRGRGAATATPGERPAAGQHRQHRAWQLRRRLGARLRVLRAVRLGVVPGLSPPAGSLPPGLRAGAAGAAADAWPALGHVAPGRQSGALQDQPAPPRRHPRQVRHRQRRARGARRRLGSPPTRRHRPLPTAARPAHPLRAGDCADQPRARFHPEPCVLRGPRLSRGRLRHLGAGRQGQPRPAGAQRQFNRPGEGCLGGPRRPRSLRPPRRWQLLPHHPPRRDRAPAPRPAQPAASGIGQQGGRQRLPGGDRLPRLGGGGSEAGGPHPRHDPPRAGWPLRLQALPPRWPPVRERGRDPAALRAGGAGRVRAH